MKPQRNSIGTPLSIADLERTTGGAANLGNLANLLKNLNLNNLPKQLQNLLKKLGQ